MTATILTIVSGLIGLAVVIFKWQTDPVRTMEKLHRELDLVTKELQAIERTRDEALKKGDADALTRFADDFVRMCERKKYLLQRIGQGPVGKGA